MEHFISNKIGRTIVLKLEEGDMVLESIKVLCEKENIKNAAVLSGTGTLSQARVHRISSLECPPAQMVDTIDNTPLELASLDGFIADGDLHIHCVLGAPGKVWAGHLMNECRIEFFGEIVIQELLGINLERHPNEKGAPHLFAKAE